MQTPLLTLDEALRLLTEALPCPGLPQATADRDDPATDRSSMDGVALRSSDGPGPRTLGSTLFAGVDPAGWRVEPGTCIRIMTGAVVPEGADAVVPVERIAVQDGFVTLQEPPKPGAFIRRQGEQARRGDTLLPAGRPRSAARTGLFASIGQPLSTLRRLRVAVASTGDEVVANPAPHQLRDANGPMLAELARILGAEVEALPAVPDEAEALAAFFERAAGYDVVLTSGGVSMGEKDLLPEALREAGARLLFHKIRLKPGKPTLVALLRETVFLALPGNPVSAYLNARILLPLVFARLQGRATPPLWRQADLLEPVANPDNRPLLHPCIWEGEGLRPLPSRGSADLVRLAQADAFAWICEGGAEPGPVRCLDVL